MSRYDGSPDPRFVAYIEKACCCRRGHMCGFCARWLLPPTKTSRSARAW